MKINGKKITPNELAKIAVADLVDRTDGLFDEVNETEGGKCNGYFLHHEISMTQKESDELARLISKHTDRILKMLNAKSLYE